MEAIKFSTQVNKAECFSSIIISRIYSEKFIRNIIFFAILIILSGIDYYTSGENGLIFLAASIFSAYSIIFFFVFTFIKVSKAKNFIVSDWEITEDYLKVITSKLEVRAPFEIFNKASETKNFILMWFHNGNPLVLPKRCVTDDDINKLKSFIAKHPKVKLKFKR